MEVLKMKTTRPYIRFDFELAAQEGTSVALVLAALIDHFEYFEKNKQLKNGKFFNTKEMIGSKTNLKATAVKKAELRLEEMGYITTTPRKGTAGRLNDYTIHFDVINQPLGMVKPTNKNDLITPKDSINQSLGMVESPLRNGEPDQIITPNNNNKEIITKEGEQMNEPKSLMDEMIDDAFAEIIEYSKPKLIPEKPKKIRNITFIPSKPSKPTPITSESILNKLSRI
jgi:hypothetical protein